MSSDQIDPVVPLTIEGVEFGDEMAEDIILVGCGVAEVLIMLSETPAEQLEAIGYEQEHIELFEDAFRTFERLSDRHETEEFMDDVSVIDDDIMEEIAETFTPIAPLFVEEFQLPDGYQDDDEIDVLEYLDVDVRWLGG